MFYQSDLILVIDRASQHVYTVEITSIQRHDVESTLFQCRVPVESLNYYLVMGLKCDRMANSVVSDQTAPKRASLIGTITFTDACPSECFTYGNLELYMAVNK